MTSTLSSSAPGARAALLPWAAALITMILWASSFVVIRAAGEHFSPGALALLRLVSASVVLAVWMLLRRPSPPRGRCTWMLIIVYGVAWFFLYTVVLNAAEHWLDAGTASMLVNIAPLLIALYSGLFMGEGLPLRLVAGILAAFAGVVIIGVSDSAARATAAGLTLGVLAAVLYAAGVLIQKAALHRADPTAVTVLGCWTGTVAALPFAPHLVAELGAAPWQSTLAVVYLGVLPTAVAFSLWAYALARTPAGLLSASSLVVPAFAVALSWLVLAEVPGWGAAFGGALCLAGAGAAIIPVIRVSLRGASAPRPGHSSSDGEAHSDGGANPVAARRRDGLDERVRPPCLSRSGSPASRTTRR